MLQEDIQLLKFLGMDAFRFSISWTRVLPSKKLGYAHEGYVYLIEWLALIDPLARVTYMKFCFSWKS